MNNYKPVPNTEDLDNQERKIPFSELEAYAKELTKRLEESEEILQKERKENLDRLS